MKRIKFNNDLKKSLKVLREKLGPAHLDENMTNVIGGCGGICWKTCSWYCEQWANEEVIIEPPGG